MKRYIRNKTIKFNDVNDIKIDKSLKNDLRADSFKRLKHKDTVKKLSRIKKLNQRKLKKLKTLRIKRERNTHIEHCAESLEANLPRSERWFRGLYLKEDIRRTFSEDLFKDQFNRPFNSKYIPDVCNTGYKYIIEVDGSYHDRPDQRLKDIKRDYYFEKRGYLVIRVKHNDFASYADCVSKVRARVFEVDLIESERRKCP